MMTTTSSNATDGIIYKLIQLTCFAVFTSFFIVGFAEPKYSVKEGLSFDAHEPSNEAIAVYAGTSLSILGLKGIAKTIAGNLGGQ